VGFPAGTRPENPVFIGRRRNLIAEMESENAKATTGLFVPGAQLIMSKGEGDHRQTDIEYNHQSETGIAPLELVSSSNRGSLRHSVR
jgi:hypothetical protein